MLKVISPTGCVHAVDNISMHHQAKFYSTMCNHAGWRHRYYHEWNETKVLDVTCKRCLKVMNKKIKRKETDWTRARRSCEHRYPHLKHGVLCNESDKFRAEVAMRKCSSLLCPVPHVLTPAAMVEELVRETIINIGKELVRADRAFKSRFYMIAVHCGWRKPNTHKGDTIPFKCTNPRLKNPNFRWACGMGSCPHMDRAMDWRANNDM